MLVVALRKKVCFDGQPSLKSAYTADEMTWKAVIQLLINYGVIICRHCWCFR